MHKNLLKKDYFPVENAVEKCYNKIPSNSKPKPKPRRDVYL